MIKGDTIYISWILLKIIILIEIILLTGCCKKDNKIIYGNLSDIEGNTYKTVVIWNQTWMAENLKTSRFNDGIAIPLITENSVWSTLYTPAYCLFDNNADKIEYGVLYNWYTVHSGKLCPAGWHVPTDTEWTSLINYLGGNSVALGKLKETGTIHWNDPNTNATNETGFTALPGGKRYSFAPAAGFPEFGGFGNSAFWWSSTEFDIDNALGVDLNNLLLTISSYPNYKVDGLYVRCIKD